jgi:type IV secretory pathway VirB9-like protein
MMDLTYTTDKMFTRFIPQTTAGENAWRELAAQNDGVATVFNFHAQAVIAGLRNAGYKVAKAAKQKISMVEIDSLLAELAA